jgi:hypothetical protein
MKILDNGYVYKVTQVSDTVEERILIGGIERDVVEGDELVHYIFDEEEGDYVEVSREPYTHPEPETDELTQLKLAMAEMAEAYEQSLTELQIALAEVADLVAGGEG